MFLRFITVRGAPYHLAKTSAKQTEESRKYQNFCIM